MSRARVTGHDGDELRCVGHQRDRRQVKGIQGPDGLRGERSTGAREDVIGDGHHGAPRTQASQGAAGLSLLVLSQATVVAGSPQTTLRLGEGEPPVASTGPGRESALGPWQRAGGADTGWQGFTSTVAAFGASPREE